jgi:ribosomal protein S13
MVGRRKLTAPGEKIPAMTTYIPDALKKAEQRVCTHLGVNLSQRVRKLFEEDIAKFEGNELKEEFDLAEKEDERLKWSTREAKLKKILEDTPVNAKYPALKVLTDFAVRFGTDRTFSKDIDDVMVKLKAYRCSGAEAFDDGAVFSLIMYIDALVHRRTVEEEIRQHWQAPKSAKLLPPIVA